MRNDEVLRQMVIDELESEPLIDSSAIGIAVQDGVLTLTGHVDSYAKKTAIEQAVRRVSGIRALAEEVKVEIPALHKRDDTDIADAAVTALYWDVSVPSDKLVVKVENGWLTLTGKVKFGYQKTAAERAVQNLTGVHGIRNLVEIEPQTSADLVKKEIARAFHRTIEREIDAIKVETSNGVATLRGVVRTWSERNEAGRAAGSVPGVAVVQNYIAVSA